MNGRQRRPDPEGRGMVIKLPDELHAKIRAKAGARKLSLKGYCLQIIAAALKESEPDNSKGPEALV